MSERDESNVGDGPSDAEPIDVLAPADGPALTDGPGPLDGSGSTVGDGAPDEPKADGDPGSAHTRRALSANFVTSLLLQGIGVATGIILARSLGATDRGELAAAMLWPALLGAFATLGLEESVTFHIARAPRTAGRVIGSAVTLALIQALVFVAICAGLVPLVLSQHSTSTVVSALIYLFFIPINAVGVVVIGALNGSLRPRTFNLIRFSVGASALMAQGVLLILGTLTVRHMVVGYILSLLAVLVLAIVLLAQARPGPIRPGRDTMRSLFAYGIRSHASTTPSQLNQRLDQLLISIFLSSRDLGLYVVANTLTTMTALVGGSVAYAALPSVARLEPGPERTLLARRLISGTLIASALIAAPVVLLAPYLIELLFGPSFESAANITRVLAVAVISLSTTRAIEAVLRAVGKPLDAGIAEIIALGATMVALAALLPLFGILGAAFASLLAYGVAGAWMLRRAARALDTRSRTLLVMDRELVEMLRAALRRGRGGSAD